VIVITADTPAFSRRSTGLAEIRNALLQFRTALLPRARGGGFQSEPALPPHVIL